MARAGMPDDYVRCPDCRELLTWNPGTSSYLHVVAHQCLAKLITETTTDKEGA